MWGIGTNNAKQREENGRSWGGGQLEEEQMEEEFLCLLFQSVLFI